MTACPALLESIESCRCYQSAAWLNPLRGCPWAKPSAPHATSLSCEVFAVDVVRGFGSTFQRKASCKCSPSRREGSIRISCPYTIYGADLCPAPSPTRVLASFSLRKYFLLSDSCGPRFYSFPQFCWLSDSGVFRLLRSYLLAINERNAWRGYQSWLSAIVITTCEIYPNFVGSIHSIHQPHFSWLQPPPWSSKSKSPPAILSASKGQRDQSGT